VYSVLVIYYPGGRVNVPFGLHPGPRPPPEPVEMICETDAGYDPLRNDVLEIEVR